MSDEVRRQQVLRETGALQRAILTRANSADLAAGASRCCSARVPARRIVSHASIPKRRRSGPRVNLL